MRALTAFSTAVSSTRRWKPSRRQDLRDEWSAAAHSNDDANDDTNAYSRESFASERELFDDERSLLSIEASDSSTTSSCSVLVGSRMRTPTSVASSLVLLDYRSGHSSSASTRIGVEQSSVQTAMAANTLPSPTPLLFPVPVVPQHVSRAVEIQLFLDRIERVEINSVVVRDDVVYYVLDVYRHRQQNGIPTRRRATSQQLTKLQQLQSCNSNSLATASCTTRLREPDYQIEHRYSSFARLRSNVAQLAGRRHHRSARSCSYCEALTAFFAKHELQPSLRVKLRCTSPETRKLLLSAFINALLVIGRDNHGVCTRTQRGYHPIPMLLKRFFNEQSGENFFS